MTDNIDAVKKPARPRLLTSTEMSNGMALQFPEGLRCQTCSRPLRGCDAEEIEKGGCRMICPGCHHLVFQYSFAR